MTKGIDQSITLQRNITSDEINQVKDEILKLRDHVDFSAKDLHKRCEDLSNEFKPICYSVENQTEEFMSKSEDISENELRELQCQTNRSTNHFQKGALDGINKISTDAVDVSEKPILTCDSNDAPNNTNFTVKKATEHNILGCNSEEKEIKKWTSEIVVIMDSNRKFIVPEKLFPDKKTTILKCGNISSLNRIVEDLYFYDVESVVVHVGVNDVESETHPDIIADNLLTASAKLKSKFPTTNVFLSEITPRSDDLQIKVTHVNDHLRLKASKYNLHLINHSNLQARSNFFYAKHFRSSTGVRVLARNIKGKVFSVLNSNNSLMIDSKIARNRFGNTAKKRDQPVTLNRVLNKQIPSYAEALRQREPIHFMESKIERETFDFMDSRGSIDQNYHTNKERENDPNVQMKIMYEMMKQLNIMNNNIMTLTTSFQSNRLPPDSGLVSSV